MLKENNGLKHLFRWYFNPEQERGKISACPGEELLYDLLMGKLSDDLRAEVELHLCRCDRCLQTLFETAEVLDEGHMPHASEAPEHLLERLLAQVPAGKNDFKGFLKEKMLEKLSAICNAFKGVFFRRAQEFVYVRGSRNIISENLIILEKEFEGIRLQIEIEKVRRNSSDIKVFTKHPDTGEFLDGVRLGLLSPGREVASYLATGGEALFEAMPFGWYKLTAKKADKNLGEVILRIKE